MTDHDLVTTLATLGAGYDATPGFPVNSLTALIERGLHRRFAPGSADGAGHTDALLAALRLVGRGDLSVGRLFEGHVNALALFGWYATAEQHAWLTKQLDRGAWFGVWATEPPPGVRIATDAGESRLQGAKHFASGAGGINFAIVTAQPDTGPRRIVIAPANDPARTDLSAWRVRGMRASCSGRYDLSDLPAGPVETIGAAGDYDRDPRFTAGAWRFLAVQLGGIEALVIETRKGMSENARADPIQRARFADAVVAARTAGLWVREAAIRAMREDVDAPAFVQMTRGIVERAGLDVIEAASRLLGTRSAFDGVRADKIIRDLSLYLRQGGPDHARDQAAIAWLADDVWGEGDAWW
ncbi:acyl-CoA dehydrogenase [Sphingomonas mollis]|uniref:acyl-CoA dehydrogenase n=1 Tax=Sphingomonas mollis TaxID=2795726 RepID=UPI001E398C01|nr:acyl-CoA dehydrogenase [Sphingomonas sp. BT553]